MADYHEMDGPALLLAGPGTGKTFALGRRVKHLVEERRVDPQTVAVITFTVPAAASMRGAISNPNQPLTFVDPALHPATICTMHSLGHGIVCSVHRRLGLRLPVTVVAEDYLRNLLLADAAQTAGHPRADSVQTGDCRGHGDCQPQNVAKCGICKSYKDILRACNAVDYDDQILVACDMLAQDRKLLADYRQRCTHLLVDEYQDINAGQFRLIKMLSEGQTDGLFTVGDDDQAIYSWRGGSPHFVRAFGADFGSTARVLPLQHCYRCPREILEAALSIVRRYDPDHRDKGPFTYQRSQGRKPVLHSVPSDIREAEVVAAIASEAWPAREVLVLVPHRGFVAIIADRLKRARIRYVSPEAPPGTGLRLLERLGAWLEDSNDSLALRECIEGMLHGARLGVPSRLVRRPEKRQAREDAFAQVSGLWRAVIDDHCSLWQSLTAHRTEYPLLDALSEGLEEIRAVDPKDVATFAGAAVRTLEPWRGTHGLLAEIDAWVNRPSAEAALASPALVRIMTLQAAKGLEADVVCIVGLEEGVFPKQDLSTVQLAEASRLLYVAMTRAKGELHLFHARQRQGSVAFQSAHTPASAHIFARSCFLDAIPKELVDTMYHPAK